MTDKLTVHNLCIHGYHGVQPEEKRLGQRFYLDITCDLDLARCASEDDFSKAISYRELCDLAVEVSNSGPYHLIETFGDRIAHAILEAFQDIRKVVVTVKKPSAPIAHVMDNVSVTISRLRHYRIGVSMGSNIGADQQDKKRNLCTALMWLNTLEGVDIDRMSSLYQTKPWGDTSQESYVNSCVTGWTTLAPVDLLKALKRIELQMGRVPEQKWGPRIIDLDLLFADNLDVQTKLLTLPHPEMFNRAFVLVPLAEIAGDHEIQGRLVSEALERLDIAPDDVIKLPGHFEVRV